MPKCLPVQLLQLCRQGIAYLFRDAQRRFQLRQLSLANVAEHSRISSLCSLILDSSGRLTWAFMAAHSRISRLSRSRHSLRTWSTMSKGFQFRIMSAKSLSALRNQLSTLTRQPRRGTQTGADAKNRYQLAAASAWLLGVPPAASVQKLASEPPTGKPKMAGLVYQAHLAQNGNSFPSSAS